MPVLSTQAWRLSQQRLTEEEQIQLHKELETCIEVAGTIRNSVKSNYIRSWKPVSRWQEQSGIVWKAT